MPAALASAPRLCWLSLAGNPLTSTAPPQAATVPHAVVPGVDALDYSVSKKLGDGASGDVRVAVWAGAPDWVGTSTVAVKLFHASAPSPDGHPADEAAIARAVDHPALARAVATVAGAAPPSTAGDDDDDASPPPSPGDDEDNVGYPLPPPPPPPAGLLFRVAPGAPLADKPRGEPRLLRCTWAAEKKIPPPAALRAAARLAGGLAAVHAAGIAHGDVYAHNVLCDDEGAATLVDWGAGFFVPTCGGGANAPSSSPPPSAFHAFDVRAFGIFLGELVGATHGRAASVLARAGRSAADARPDARPTAAALEALLTAEARRAGVAQLV